MKKIEEVKLIYRNKLLAKDRPHIHSSKDAFHFFAQNWDMDSIQLFEESKMLLLDRRLRVMSIASISKGGGSGTVIDPKMVFSIALKRRAHRLILAHNHPSGNLTPSHADLSLTRKFAQAGQLLELYLDDHLIISEHDYYSLADHGDMNYEL